MKVIVLNGPSNSGKTTTLHELYKHLVSAGAYDIEPPQIHPFDDRDSIYYVQYRGKRIGIVTLGDYATETVFQIGVFLSKGADTLVIANSCKAFPLTLINWHTDVLKCVIIQKNNIHEKGKVQEIVANI